MTDKHYTPVGTRLAALAGGILLASALAGCGGSNPSSTQDDKTSGVEENMQKVGHVETAAAASAPAQATQAASEPAKADAAPAASMPETKPEPAAQAQTADHTNAQTAAAAPAAGKADGEAVYKKACFACHMAGVANAPKAHDKAAWAPRLAKGMDALLKSAQNGVPGTAMPPRGNCGDCSDEDLKAAIVFMSGQQ